MNIIPFPQEVQPLTALELLKIFDNEIDSYNTSKLTSHLNSLNDSELNKLITNFLYESISFQRHLSDIVMQSKSSVDTEFYKATIWHMADATHNMPACLSIPKEGETEEPKVMYIEHYLCFLKALKMLSQRFSNLSGHIIIEPYEKYITMLHPWMQHE